MFDSLQDNLRSAVKTLRGKGKMTEANMREGLQKIEDSLLEADVSYAVVKDFMTGVREQALGEKVLLSLDPSEQVWGIVHKALIDILGPVDPSLHLRGEITVIMLCGLQGSGKTTTCGKLSRLILQNKSKPMLCAADLQRPAAIEQLHVIGEQVGVPVYSEDGAQDPVKVCRNAIAKAKEEGCQVVILDTAGRLAIDEELMAELKRIDDRCKPDQVYLVVDGMTGQDAVNSAGAFNDALELDGVIMTKLDGDARGGALLSVKHVTGVPIKFMGTGEQLDALEPFHPDRMAGRILGGGDMLSMVEMAQQEFDQDEMRKTQERLEQGQFTLDDFLKQLQQMAKPGLMQKMMGLLPGMGELKKMFGGDHEGEIKRLQGIIHSMTPAERKNPKVIDQSRRARIAKGAGVQPQQINDLVKQFDGMSSLMTGMAGKSMTERMKAIQDLQSGGLLDPSGKGLSKQKKGTGKRERPQISAAEKKKRQKDRKRNQKKNKRRK